MYCWRRCLSVKFAVFQTVLLVKSILRPAKCCTTLITSWYLNRWATRNLIIRPDYRPNPSKGKNPYICNKLSQLKLLLITAFVFLRNIASACILIIFIYQGCFCCWFFGLGYRGAVILKGFPTQTTNLNTLGLSTACHKVPCWACTRTAMGLFGSGQGTV